MLLCAVDFSSSYGTAALCSAITLHSILFLHGLAGARTGLTPNVIALVKLLLHGLCFALSQTCLGSQITKTFWLMTKRNSKSMESYRPKVNFSMCMGPYQTDSSPTTQTNSSGKSSHVNRTSTLLHGERACWGRGLLLDQKNAFLSPS